MDKHTVLPLVLLAGGAAAILALLAYAGPSSFAAWLGLGAFLVLPYGLAALATLSLAKRSSRLWLLLIALLPMAAGLVFAASPFLGEPDAQGGLAIFLAPVIQIVVLGILLLLRLVKR